MGSEESDARWHDLLVAREEFDRDEVAMPTLLSRVDGRPLEPSPRAVRFAEALAVSASWTRISSARDRRLAA